MILHELAHAAVVLVGGLLLDARAAASLPANGNDLVWLRSQSYFMNFIDLICGSGRLRSGALRRSFLKFASVSDSSFSVEGVLVGSRVLLPELGTLLTVHLT